MRPSPSHLFIRTPRQLNEGEEGMLSLASLFVVLGLLVLIGMLTNVGTVTSRKLETQNAADSVAYSATVEMARGMNSVTAVNHLIGELTALVVLIHTLGGDELDQNKSGPSTPPLLDLTLDIAYGFAESMSYDSVAVDDDAYNEASKDSGVGGAIYDARMRLKMVLAWAYEAHFFGGLIAQGQFIPIVGPILEAYGDSVCIAAYAFEFKVWQECETLDGLEDMARYLQPLKAAIRDDVVPALQAYQSLLIYATPFKARDAANAMAAPNLADVSLYPSWPFINLNLPVEKESDQVSVERSQLMRASTPWIQWWRQPWIDFGKNALILSRFATYFENRSTQYTQSVLKSMKDNGVHLYVMSSPDPQGRGKTYEPWTFVGGSAQVDQMFCLVGMAHRPAPAVATGFFFRQENPDGMVCFAQAMFYNANPQQRGSGNNDWQPTAGWDTLNWAGPAPEYPGPVPQGDPTPTPTTPQPLIRLNWQAKLVPTTRLTEASLFQSGSIRNVLWRTNTAGPMSKTH
jgi:hypothetical protein